jgi:DAK2 domain fusion protein YloV
MSGDLQTALKINQSEQVEKAPINGQTLKQLTEAGLTWLKTNQQLVNSLNVFPVPDGDTGTNMVLTMQSAYNEISDLPERNIGRMAQAVAHGALMGARGNSGVILSQIWRGFARALDDQEVLDGTTLVRAFNMARDTAYKGVVRPVEGTILTVTKDVAAAAETALKETDDPKFILEYIVKAADASVQRTPDLLPVLKEAGVVDSGGKGLFFILEGMLRHIQGQPLDILTTVQPLVAMHLDEHVLENVEAGQDYEIVMDFKPDSPLNLEDYFKNLESMGTSIQFGEGDGIYRVHIHVPSERRYKPIDYTMSLGTVTKIAIENLTEQMENIEDKESRSTMNLAMVEPGQSAAVAVAPGPGIARVFASLGVAAIVPGGQTMNPSTQEILHAFENLPADKIVVLPNNKNIIMAAQAAANLTVKKVIVIPSNSVPQGLAAMLRWAPDADFETLAQDMTSSLEDVQTGEITRATRSVEIDGVRIKEGEVIALFNGKLVLSGNDIEDASLKLLNHAHVEDYELITMFYGADIPRQQAFVIADMIRAVYPQQEVEIQDGGQPHYQFIIAIE